MRKEADVTITAEGRDKGKVFHLTEMPAMQAEKWATRALMAAARAGIDTGDVFSGMQGIAFVGLQALMRMNYFEIEPLLDEMWTCIKIKPDPRNPSVIRDLVENDIEEIATRLQLRREVINLHVNFSTAGGLSKPASETPAPAIAS